MDSFKWKPRGDIPILGESPYFGSPWLTIAIESMRERSDLFAEGVRIDEFKTLGSPTWDTAKLQRYGFEPLAGGWQCDSRITAGAAKEKPTISSQQGHASILLALCGPYGSVMGLSFQRVPLLVSLFSGKPKRNTARGKLLVSQV